MSILLLDKSSSTINKHAVVILCCLFCVSDEVLSASDELGQVFDKYTAIVLQKKRPASQTSKSGSASLLDLSTPSEEKLPPVPVELLGNQLAGLGIGFCFFKFLLNCFVSIIVVTVSSLTHVTSCKYTLQTVSLQCSCCIRKDTCSP